MSEANTPRERPHPAARRDETDVDVERGVDTEEDRSFTPVQDVHAPDGEPGGSGRETNPETDSRPRDSEGDGAATSEDLN